MRHFWWFSNTVLPRKEKVKIANCSRKTKLKYEIAYFTAGRKTVKQKLLSKWYKRMNRIIIFLDDDLHIWALLHASTVSAECLFLNQLFETSSSHLIFQSSTSEIGFFFFFLFIWHQFDISQDFYFKGNLTL